MSYLVCNKSFVNKYGTKDFDSFLAEVLSNDIVDKVYFVTATNRLARNFELQLAKMYFEMHNKPLVNPKIGNLESLIRTAFSYFVPNGSSKIIGDSFRFLIFYQAFNFSSLRFFINPNSNRKESLHTVRWLSQIVFGLKEDGITPEKLFEELINQDPAIVNEAKFQDTYSVFQKYEELLKEYDVFDIVSAMKYCTEKISDYGRDSDTHPVLPFFDKEEAIVLSYFFDFKAPEVEFLTSMLNFRNPLAIYLDFDENNGPLFGNFIELIGLFKQKGFLTISLPMPELDGTRLPPSIFIRKYLFNNFGYFQNPDLSKQVRIYSCENRFNEVAEIVRLCNYLIQLKGYKPSEICIVTKSPEKYVPIFREAFNREKIPLNATERFKLSTSPLVLSIFAVFDTVLNNFRFSDLRKVFQSFYFRFYETNSDSSKPRLLDIDSLLSAMISMRLIGGAGKEYYRFRFEKRISSYKEAIQRLRNVQNPDETEIKDLERKLQVFEKAYEVLKTVLDYFDFEDTYYTPEEFSRLVHRILKKFHTFEVLQQTIDFSLNELPNLELEDKIIKLEEVERDSRAFSKFLKILDEFVFYLNRGYRKKERKFKLSELVELFKVLVFSEKFQLSIKQNYAVNLTSIEQTRGIPFKVMILCGAIDGEFPSRYNPEIFLGKKLGKTEKRHFENERYEFYLFLTNSPASLDEGNNEIYIFYPRRDVKREYVRSSFINFLLDLIGKTEDEAIVHLHSTLSLTDDIFELAPWKQYLLTPDELFLKMAFPDKLFSWNSITEYPLNVELEESLLNSFAKDYLEKVISEPVSAEFFEDYIHCPYKFFARRILRLQKPQFDFDMFLTNLERGIILHQILSRFYKYLAKEQAEKNRSAAIIRIKDFEFNPVYLDISDYSHYESVLGQITDEVLDAFESFSSFFDLERERFFSKSRSKLGIVQRWLSYEISKIEQKQFTPIIFELPFGFRRARFSLPEVSVKLDSKHEIKLIGKIDRIDYAETSFDGNPQIEFWIIDYKFSKSECKSLSDVLKGRSFQMPFYAIAFSEILKNYSNIGNDFIINLSYQILNYKVKGNANNSNELYKNYQDFYIDSRSVLAENKKRQKTVKVPINKDLEINFVVSLEFGGKVSLEDLLNQSLEWTKAIIKAISRTLQFPVKPMYPNFCKQCNYKTVCKNNLAT